MTDMPTDDLATENDRLKSENAYLKELIQRMVQVESERQDKERLIQTLWTVAATVVDKMNEKAESRKENES